MPDTKLQPKNKDSVMRTPQIAIPPLHIITQVKKTLKNTEIWTS